MSKIKQFLENVSVDIGFAGEINDEVRMKGAQLLRNSIPNMPVGDTEIWYMRPEWFAKGSMGRKPDPNNLGDTHSCLGATGLTDLEEIFLNMQKKRWSPNGEARAFIHKKGVMHTSMSTGDVVKIGDEVWLCIVTGWLKLD